MTLFSRWFAITNAIKTWLIKTFSRLQMIKYSSLKTINLKVQRVESIKKSFTWPCKFITNIVLDLLHRIKWSGCLGWIWTELHRTPPALPPIPPWNVCKHSADLIFQIWLNEQQSNKNIFYKKNFMDYMTRHNHQVEWHHRYERKWK